MTTDDLAWVQSRLRNCTNARRQLRICAECLCVDEGTLLESLGYASLDAFRAVHPQNKRSCGPSVERIYNPVPPEVMLESILYYYSGAPISSVCRMMGYTQTVTPEAIRHRVCSWKKKHPALAAGMPHKRPKPKKETKPMKMTYDEAGLPAYAYARSRYTNNIVRIVRGERTAEASTYTKSMLNELGDTGSSVGKILKQQTGKSFSELNADGKSLGDVLQVLYDSVGGNATKFAGLWSSVEAGTGALSLASSGADKFNGVLQQMQADSGATQTAYDTMTNTMAYKLDGVKTNAQNLGTALFDAVSGRLGEGVALAGGYLQTLSESVQQNGIAGLAQGLAVVFTDLTTNVGPQLLQTGTALLGKLGDGLVTGIPQLLAQALPVVANLASGLRENAGQLVDAGIQFILNLATGLMNGLPTMITYLPGIVSDIAGIINDNAPKLLVAGVQLIVTLGQGLIQAIPALVANLPQIIQAVVDVWTAFNWLDLGGKVIKLMGSGIKNMAGFVSSSVKGMMEQPIAYLKSLPEKFCQWGKDMIQGMIRGITSMIDGVVGSVKNVASAIASVIHFSRPDIGPLRSYEQWMPDFMSGLAKGIRDNLWMVEDAADALALTTAQPMQLQVAGVLRGNQQTAAASWQPQPGVAYQQTNNFYTHDSLSESELTREAEDMMNRLRWGIP